MLLLAILGLVGVLPISNVVFFGLIGALAVARLIQHFKRVRIVPFE